jgi:surface polysaccharide O-acyltransferase-like enzyme
MTSRRDNTISESRVVYSDVLRILAIFFVILMHVTVIYISEHVINLNTWIPALLYDNISRWCVPVFFMVSGMFLLDPSKANESTKNFLKKRLVAVLIPFITWNIIYAIYRVSIDPSLGFTNLILMGFGSEIYYHMWFVYTLIGLYLITPVVRVFTKYATKGQLEYYLISWFVLTALTSFLTQQFNFNLGFDLRYITGYLGFFILGYYLKNLILSARILRLVYATGIISLIFAFVGNYLLNYKNLFLKNFIFNDFLSINIILTSIALFMFVKNLDPKLQSLAVVRKAVRIPNLSRIVFGIYLFHPLVLDFLKSKTLAINYVILAPYSWALIPTYTIGIFVFCFMCFVIADILARHFRILGFLRLFY